MQHYGYFTDGPTEMQFDLDWEDNRYFVSTKETAVELQVLSRFDAELLVGQTSYKQRAEIYNIIHGYNFVKKKCEGVESQFLRRRYRGFISGICVTTQNAFYCKLTL